MKKFLFSFTVLLLSAMMVFAQKAGDKISFSSKDMSGNTVTDEIFAKNKVTMINIWGTFCSPCIREMPDLGKINKEYKDKGFEIIGIPIDIIDGRANIIADKKSTGDTIIKQTGADYIHVVPTREMMTTGLLRGIQAVPTTIFVDSDGKQIGNAYLGARSKRDWQKIIDKLLK